MCLFLRKDKKFIKRRHWRSVIGTISEHEYRMKCELLDEAGIDYRVWIDPDAPVIVYFRENLNNPERYRLHFNFYVRRRDYYKACRVLNINTMYWGGISAIFF